VIVLDSATHLEPVESRKHEVEDDEIGTGRGDEFDRRRPVARQLHDMAIAAKSGSNGLGQLCLVINHHDVCHSSEITELMCSNRCGGGEDPVQ